ncbi:MAG: response regulator transcription factor [Candidatus Dormibacteraceae bacterium]
MPPGLHVYRPLALLGSRVLVVEDEQQIQIQLQLDLRGLGYEPVVAGTAADARELLSHERIAAVLLDLVLDDREDAGFDLLAWIRQHHPGLPVIVLSAAQVSSAAIRRAYELGASSYFVKGTVPMAHIYSDLAARIMDSSAGLGLYRFGPLQFDPIQRTMRAGEREVRLTSQQTSIVVFLAQGSKPATPADLIAAGLFTPDAARTTVHSALVTLRRRIDQLEEGLGKRFLISTASGYTLSSLDE